METEKKKSGGQTKPTTQKVVKVQFYLPYMVSIKWPAAKVKSMIMQAENGEFVPAKPQGHTPLPTDRQAKLDALRNIPGVTTASNMDKPQQVQVMSSGPFGEIPKTMPPRQVIERPELQRRLDKFINIAYASNEYGLKVIDQWLDKMSDQIVS